MRTIIVRVGEKYPIEYETLLSNTLEYYAREKPFILNNQTRFYNWPGWWSKMELFSPELRDLRPFLYFDLDTYIIGDIRDMLSWIPDQLWMLEDAYQKGKGQSAIMAIPKDVDEIWDTWIQNPKQWMELPGDQDFLRKFNPTFLQDRFEGIYSYKADDCYEEPKGRVVFFHGRPRPHEAEGWAKEFYESNTRSLK